MGLIKYLFYLLGACIIIYNLFIILYVFENIARLSEQMILRKEAGGELTNSLYPWISLAFHYAIDILFSGTALYYFTRSKVKEQFI